MAIVVRDASSLQDRACAISLLQRYLNPAYSVDRFEWLYDRNPVGAGRLWLAIESATGEAVGTAGAFPRLFLVDGRDVLCWVLGDFCVADHQRALGAAVKLQRACMHPADESQTGFCYDFPSKAMMPVYQRLRISPSAAIRRHAKLVRADAKVNGVLRLVPPIGWAVRWVLNAALAVSHRHREPNGLVMSLQEGPCGQEYSRLAESESQWYGVCGKRTAQYLNWRYRENPLSRHEILAARVDGRLVSYVVFTASASEATIVDLFGAPDPAVFRALIQRVTTTVRREGRSSVSVHLLDRHPWTDMFRRLGFAQRESSPVMMVPGGLQRANGGGRVGEKVFLMAGDRDS